jgi:hypothetical protein
VHGVLLGREHLGAERAGEPAFDDLVEPPASMAGRAPLVLDLNDPQLLLEATNVSQGEEGWPGARRLPWGCPGAVLLCAPVKDSQPWQDGPGDGLAPGADDCRLPCRRRLQLRGLGHSAALVMQRPARVKVVLGEALGRDDAALELSMCAVRPGGWARVRATAGAAAGAGLPGPECWC